MYGGGDPASRLPAGSFPPPPPPASVAMLLTRTQTSAGGMQQTRNSKIAEFAVGDGDTVITGSRTVQVEIKE